MQKSVSLNLNELLKPINPYLIRVDEEIKKKLHTGISILDNSALHLFQKGGKKIRASLLLLGSGLKNKIPEDIIEIAAAVEIVHGATLIHDDIIDHSLFRRGDVTVQKKWGNKVAVLVGDFMYTKALEVVVGDSRTHLFPELISSAVDMLMGELYQMEYSNIDLINKKHYYKIIELKTAIFMATCVKLGAVQAEMSDEERDSLYQFGLNLGYAFQIIDDTLDYIEDRELVGKDGGNDFLNGKITLPFLHLLEVSAEKEKAKLTDYARNPDFSNWKIVRKSMMNSVAIDYCKGDAEKWVKKALSYLDGFPSTVYKETLINLTTFLVGREY